MQVGWLNQSNYSAPAFRQSQFIPQKVLAKNNVVLAVAYRLAYRSATPERVPLQQD